MHKILIHAVPALVAALAVLAIVPWIFGIPGISTGNYAMGWRLGFDALLLYPAACLLLLAVRWIAGRYRLSLLGKLAISALWMALAAFIAAQIVAWDLILKP